MPRIGESVGTAMALMDLGDGRSIALNRDTGRWATLTPAALGQLLRSVDDGTSSLETQPALKRLIAPPQKGSAGDTKSLYIIFKLTQGCNFSCSYCYDKVILRKLNRQKRDATYHELVSRAVIDGGGRAFVLLHGGEPLLEMDSVRELVLESRRRYGPAVQFSIQTNGSLLDEEILAFFREHNVGISVSVDGASDDDNRLRLMKRVDANPYERLRGLLSRSDQVGPSDLGLHLTITPHNLPRVLPILLQMQRDGFRSVSFSFYQPVTPGLLPEWEGATVAQAMLAIVDAINDGHLTALAVQHLIQVAQRVIGMDGGFMCLTSPCGAGRHLVALYPSGEVGPCDSIFDPDFLFDSVDKYEGEKALSALRGLLDRDVEKLTPCRTCDVKRLCNGTCPGSAKLTGGDLNGVDSFECAMNFELLSGMLRRLGGTSHQAFVDYCRAHITERRQLRRDLTRGDGPVRAAPLAAPVGAAP